MGRFSGRRVPLSLPRKWIGDLMHAAAGVPFVTFERRVSVAAVAAERGRFAHPPSWVLLFTKAYAAVSARRPDLRRAYLRFPRPHLFQFDASVATVAVEREYAGEPAVFFGHLRTPDRQPLPQLVRHLHDWRTKPVSEVRAFARMVRYTRWPTPLRRVLWWYAANVAPGVRARSFGTFGVSVTASAGATATNLISPVATTLNYGLFDADHSLTVRLHFDHRVLDGGPAARALAELEEEMNTGIAGELRDLADRGLDLDPAAQPVGEEVGV